MTEAEHTAIVIRTLANSALMITGAGATRDAAEAMSALLCASAALAIAACAVPPGIELTPRELFQKSAGEAWDLMLAANPKMGGETTFRANGPLRVVKP